MSVMGDGTHLSLADLADKNCTFFPVDLFTLSACDTAMGSGEQGSGSEVEGLGAQIQHQGARSVLATLWSVEDASTGQLLQRFLRTEGEWLHQE